jgi:hypothetical protein
LPTPLGPVFLAGQALAMSYLKAAIAIPALIAFSMLVKFYRKIHRRYIA